MELCVINVKKLKALTVRVVGKYKISMLKMHIDNGYITRYYEAYINGKMVDVTMASQSKDYVSVDQDYIDVKNIIDEIYGHMPH